MAKIVEVAAALTKLNDRQVQEIAYIMKPDTDIKDAKELFYIAEKERTSPSSPKQYGISLLNKKRRKI
jgi:hypothetical protein